MKQIQLKQKRNRRRKLSVRNRLARSGPKVRLSVHRSSKHIYAQIIDDATGATLCGSGSTAGRFKDELGGKTKSEQAAFIGGEIARQALEKGVEQVVFDRGSHKYHGRVKALADAAREGGLKF
jgi:large subunit ribosomal protein L18